jgi:O-6-methylguanine DNA methyltransferase
MKSDHQTVYYGKVDSEIGAFYIAATDKGLCFIGSPSEALGSIKEKITRQNSEVTFIENDKKIKKYIDQLLEYLNGDRTIFDIPIDIQGTAFQEAVWDELKNIPYGETVSYSDIAQNIEKPNAVRAVGTAIGANPVLMVIPCHRVVSKSGQLTGFRGGISMKEELLNLEIRNKDKRINS